MPTSLPIDEAEPPQKIVSGTNFTETCVMLYRKCNTFYTFANIANFYNHCFPELGPHAVQQKENPPLTILSSNTGMTNDLEGTQDKYMLLLIMMCN